MKQSVFLNCPNSFKVSADKNLQNSLHREEIPQKDKKIDDCHYFKQEQGAIKSLIDELKIFSSRLQDCEAVKNRMRQTDLSKEDQDFLIKILLEHRYINDNIKSKGISGILSFIKSQLHSHQKQNMHLQCSQKASNDSPFPSVSLHQKIQNSSAFLENHHKSRIPFGKLCSIANVNLESNLNSKFGTSKLSQISEIDRSNKMEEIEEAKEKGVKGFNNQVIAQSQTGRYKDESQDCYDFKLNLRPVECKQPSLALDLQRINQNDKQSKFSIFGEESFNVKETAEKIYEKIKFPLTHKSHQHSERVRKPQHTQLISSQSQTQSKNSSSSCSRYSILIKQVTSEGLVGQLDKIDYEICFGSINKVIMQNGYFGVFVEPLGLLCLRFEQKGMARVFCENLRMYNRMNQK